MLQRLGKQAPLIRSNDEVTGAMPRKRSAKLIILKQTAQRLPEFHRCAARLMARGQIVNPGDLLIAFRVDSTIPSGPVLVTDSTEFVFAS